MSNSRMFATTLANGISILQSFNADDSGLSNKDLVERTGLSKATISRLTYTLVIKGLLSYDKITRRYHLGAGIFSLGHPLLHNIKLRQLARPYMQELALYAGGSVSLGMYDLGHMVYIETCRGHHIVSFRPDIGARLPVFSTAMGLTWLACLSPSQHKTIIDTIAPLHPKQYQHFEKYWPEQQKNFSNYGFCTSPGYWQSDVHAVALPWKKKIHNEQLIFNCGIPTVHLKGRRLELFGLKLLEMVEKIEKINYE